MNFHNVPRLRPLSPSMCPRTPLHFFNTLIQSSHKEHTTLNYKYSDSRDIRCQYIRLAMDKGNWELEKLHQHSINNRLVHKRSGRNVNSTGKRQYPSANASSHQKTDPELLKNSQAKRKRGMYRGISS